MAQGRWSRVGRGPVTDAECPCRVLEALWELLLQTILQALGTNVDVSADFYSRFHFTLEVGPSGGGALPSSREKAAASLLGPAARVPGPPSQDVSSGNPQGQHFFPTSPPVSELATC